MLQHHRLSSTAPEATVPLSEWTPIYRLRTNAEKFWKMDIFTSDDTTDTAFSADPPNYVLLWVEHWRKVVIYWD
jgi:hypothetical protein